MGMRVFWIILIVAALVGGFFVYDHYRVEKQAADGAVVCQGCMTADEKARFDKENSGETADGNSDHKTRTSRAEDAAGNPGGAVAAGQVAPNVVNPTTTATATNTPATAPITAASTTTATTTSAPAAAAPAPTPSAGTYSLNGGATASTLPASDSVSPNPTNNVRFVGNGSYQWYRQGNLTWRVDTVGGGSCIAFATLEEWRKQIVYSHGCGRGGA